MPLSVYLLFVQPHSCRIKYINRTKCINHRFIKKCKKTVNYFRTVKSKQLKILIHVICWILYFSLPLLFYSKPNYPEFENQAPSNIQMFQKQLPLNICAVLFFYLNLSILVPRLLLRKKFFLFVLAVGLSYGVTFFVVRTLAPVPDASLPRYLRALTSVRTTYINFIFTFIFLLSTAIPVTIEWLRLEQRSKDIEAEKISTELSYLKVQVNPHFLFNSLNSIYSLALAHSEATPDAVMKLSNLMRYIMYETKEDLIPVEKCVNYMQQYIDLQRLRLSTKNKVNLNLSGDFASRKIAPLLMIPFVENAFKYGVTNHQESEINISVGLDDSLLLFHINNPIHHSGNGKSDSGIGIENVRKRLSLLYPDKHHLIIKKENNHFDVDLNIELA
jgi:two-component system LytT family sensor kinase